MSIEILQITIYKLLMSKNSIVKFDNKTNKIL